MKIPNKVLMDINEKIMKQYPLRIKDMGLETDAGDILHYIELV
jgi:hypothetical protein